MEDNDDKLCTTIPFNVRFCEVDSMNIVWHGNYMQYFEDAREAFGKAYGLDYLTIFHHGYYAPLVDISFSYRRPLIYGIKPTITIEYQPTDSAKVVFNYVIKDSSDGSLLTTGHSVQVFMDMQYELVLCNPPFYEEWKKKYLPLPSGNDMPSQQGGCISDIKK